MLDAESGSLADIVLARRLLSTGRGERIREAAGLKRAEIASRCEVTLTTYCRWIGGTAVPRPRHATRYLTEMKGLLATLDQLGIESPE